MFQIGIVLEKQVASRVTLDSKLQIFNPTCRTVHTSISNSQAPATLDTDTLPWIYPHPALKNKSQT